MVRRVGRVFLSTYWCRRPNWICLCLYLSWIDLIKEWNEIPSTPKSMIDLLTHRQYFIVFLTVCKQRSLTFRSSFQTIF